MSKKGRIQKPDHPRAGSTIAQRLQYLAEETPITKYVKIDDVILKGHRQPDLQLITAINRRLPHLHTNWLVSGEGTPFVETDEEEIKIHANFKDINQRIKNIRIKHRLSQAEFAKMLGYSRSRISSAELHRQSFRINDLRFIKRKFNVSYDWLIDGIENTSTNPEFAKLEKKIKDLKEQVEMLKTLNAYQKSELSKLKQE